LISNCIWVYIWPELDVSLSRPFSYMVTSMRIWRARKFNQIMVVIWSLPLVRPFMFSVLCSSDASAAAYAWLPAWSVVVLMLQQLSDTHRLCMSVASQQKTNYWSKCSRCASHKNMTCLKARFSASHRMFIFYSGKINQMKTYKVSSIYTSDIV
jgi:hypothetical protein